jgi:CDGSH-type Zn-finger protein
MTNNAPYIAKKAPYKITVEKEKIYFICSCGYSKKQPFYDGSHQKESPSRRSIKYQATEIRKYIFVVVSIVQICLYAMDLIIVYRLSILTAKIKSLS